jgi:hypothetical protein
VGERILNFHTLHPYVQLHLEEHKDNISIFHQLHTPFNKFTLTQIQTARKIRVKADDIFWEINVQTGSYTVILNGTNFLSNFRIINEFLSNHN